MMMSSPSQTSLRKALLTAQVASSVLLLVAAVLFSRSYSARIRAQGVDMGELATLQVSLSRATPATAESTAGESLARLKSHAAVNVIGHPCESPLADRSNVVSQSPDPWRQEVEKGAGPVRIAFVAIDSASLRDDGHPSPERTHAARW